MALMARWYSHLLIHGSHGHSSENDNDNNNKEWFCALLAHTCLKRKY